MRHFLKSFFLLPVLASVMFCSCGGNSEPEPVFGPDSGGDDKAEALARRIESLSSTVAEINANNEYMAILLREGCVISEYSESSSGAVFKLEKASDIALDCYKSAPGIVPVFAAAEDGKWAVSGDNGISFSPLSSKYSDGKAPQLRIGSSGVWEVSADGNGGWAALRNKAGVPISVLDGADTPGRVCGVKSIESDSKKGVITLNFMNGFSALVRYGNPEPTPPEDGKTGVKTWDDFVEGNADNVLLDFSYAGYDHGLSLPPDGFDLGYTVYNVKDYGAIPDDGKSDRAAFIAAYQAAIGPGRVSNANAKAVIYFPEGEYILHSVEDNVDGHSYMIGLQAGEFVIKGAGRDKTTLVMQDPNLPTDPKVLYSSPVMMEVINNTPLTSYPLLTNVTGDAPKGSFSLEVESTAAIAPGDLVCLNVVNNDAAFVAKELAPKSLESSMSELKDPGVQVWEYHQVASVSGTTVVFAEPIMHEVEAKWGWKILRHVCFSNVGVEDLTFKGNAKANFAHHGSWEDDGAYKPLAFLNIANGWMRRLRFTSVSEACSVIYSTNFSVYDIDIDGNRGHSAIRSQSSTRVFIGKVHDHSSDNMGQWHSVGVSKPSVGAVLWRNEWGTYSCFESHASQPRATLIDCCYGGWNAQHQGGDKALLPNHLADLVIWNFLSTKAYGSIWYWWDPNTTSCRYLPPIIVGFHGEYCKFYDGDVLVEESHGAVVEPESLYEAQLKKRLGYLPSWVDELKAISW